MSSSEPADALAKDPLAIDPLAIDPLAIDYVSPLPPVRSGISDYSVDLLPFLESRADVRVVRVPGQPIDQAIEQRFHPVDSSQIDNQLRRPLYQMGNNLYHEAIRELALEKPGFLTLHDVWLHHILMELTLGRKQMTPYTVALLRDHGWIGGAASLPPRWGAYGKAAAFSLRAHRTLLERQWGILVHSEWAAEIVRESLARGPKPGQPMVRAVPMPMPVREVGPDERVAAAEYRQKLRIPLSAPVLGSFGFQTPIKRTQVALASLAEPGLEKVHLLIGGEASKGMDLEQMARDLGVADRVRVTGFLSEADFPVAIGATDLCVNLRYPTAGETSASLLRILALGRGAIVSNYAQFAELPDGGVLKVPLDAVAEGGEVAALGALLRELFESRESVRKMGQEARRFITQHHDPETSAQAMVDALTEMERCRRLELAEHDRSPDSASVEDSRLSRVKLDKRPSSLTWGRLDYRLEVSGAESPWPVGERRRIEVRLTNVGFARLAAASSGPGGVALEVNLLAGGSRADLRKKEPWLPLPRDLESGESHCFEVHVRRPPGYSRLRVEPQVLGGDGFMRSRVEAWERMLL